MGEGTIYGEWKWISWGADEEVPWYQSEPFTIHSLFWTEEGAEELPDISVYASDIDKINIEFRNLNDSAKFKVTSENETIIEPSDIKENVYTLKYDFETPLEITVYNTSYSYKKQINPEDVRNLLAIANDEYLYLSEDTVNSNKRTLDGKYCNLYKNKILDKDGNIYDISTMNKIESTNKEIKLLDTQKTIAETNIDNKTIQTFAHCSKVTQGDKNTYKEQQIFVKNGYMYVIDGKMDNKNGSAIIDTYNNKQYETILGEDGVMYDLLTKINYPSNFKNKDIIAMTSNVENNNNVVLVYYANGKVYGFNYVTGEEVYDNNVKDENVNLANYILENLSTANISYNINKADYIAATELAGKLDKVSIEEATEKINKENNQNIEVDININGENDNNSDINDSDSDIANKDNNVISSKSQTTENILNTTQNNKNNLDNKYVTTYDPGTQSYVVYSTAELIKSDAPKTQTENEKINGNKDLISYYTNLSTSKEKLKDTGIILIAGIIASICVILIILYRKTNK